MANFPQEIDLRIGASFTRFQTMLLRDAFVLDFAADGRNVVLSYGPCQVPIYKLNYMCCYILLMKYLSNFISFQSHKVME